jgi:tRNA pseudouridine13 synthase
MTERPRLTADLPGTGGTINSIEGFLVEEIPAYLPSGEGEHCMVQIEKRELNTNQALDILCRAFSVSSKEAGSAGMKDKWAVTRQWLTLPRVSPEKLRTFNEDKLRVLQADWHGNKLRTGHLRGNRFRLVLEGIDADAQSRADAIVARLQAHGAPNYFGMQRFGADGKNAQRGFDHLSGKGKPPRDRRLRRLMISAAQSQIFNDVLAERVASQTMRTLVGGEVMQFATSNAIFISEDSEVDQQRIEGGELVITGPICGPRMPACLEESESRQIEDRIFAKYDVAPADFSKLGRLARGGRRPLWVSMADLSVDVQGDSLIAEFMLPAGAYATVILDELSKTPEQLLRQPQRN